MEELKNILMDHAARYPMMQGADAVKLIYQNEFGGGHLIRDEAACINNLYQEYAAVEKDPAAPAREYIGNGIVRVNLAALKPEDLAQLGKDFLYSAANHKGDLTRFQEKLNVLCALAETGVFSFSSDELQAYLKAYADSGYPAVSHSDTYRKLYKPAYRVILLSK